MLSDFLNHSESGTDSAMGIQMHRNSRLKVLAPPFHMACLPRFQISTPPRMTMMNGQFGRAAERQQQVRTRQGRRAPTNTKREGTGASRDRCKVLNQFEALALGGQAETRIETDKLPTLWAVFAGKQGCCELQ